MNINSQFYITNYTGKEPLDLMVKPTALIESTEIADYNRFIEAVSTIYASQNTTGMIPVFWTSRNSTTDATGGTKYTYSPNSDSTLKFLQPKESYYFILRDPTYVPLRVPTVGGSLPGFAENNQLPIISPPVSPIKLNNQSGNQYSFSVGLDKLQPYASYSYTVHGAFANWPVVVTPLSGIIKPSEPTSSIDLSVTFCTSTGLCPNGTVGLMDYTIDNNRRDLGPNTIPESLQSTLQISVTPTSYVGAEVLSKQFTVQCEDCLPKISIDMPNQPVTLTGNNNHCYDLIADLSGLVPYQEYSYEFRSTIANWPAVVTPVSGVFKSSKKTGQIRSRLAFCPSTILCASGTIGLLDYDVNQYQYLFDSTCGNFVTLELAISTPDASVPESISDKLTIYCLDCLSTINGPTLSITQVNE
jgi:uncharacterized membrane protein